MVSYILHFKLYLSTGGYDGHHHYSHILRFDKQTESWRAEGNMSEARAQHAVTSVPYTMIRQYCEN